MTKPARRQKSEASVATTPRSSGRLRLVDRRYFFLASVQESSASTGGPTGPPIEELPVSVIVISAPMRPGLASMSIMNWLLAVQPTGGAVNGPANALALQSWTTASCQVVPGDSGKPLTSRPSRVAR